MTITDALTVAREKLAALTINPLAITISGNVAKVDHAEKLIRQDALNALNELAAAIMRDEQADYIPEANTCE